MTKELTDEPTNPVPVARGPSRVSRPPIGFLLNEAESNLVAKLLHRTVEVLNNDNVRELVGGEDELETLVRLYVRMGTR